MDIRQIKERLDILEVAAHLDIPIDKRSKKACCPFHDDKTPEPTV
jgi:DNA primase